MKEQGQVPVPGRVEPRLKLALAAVAVLSAWATWWPSAAPVVGVSAPAAGAVSAAGAMAAEGAALPESLPSIHLSAAEGGGFAGSGLGYGTTYGAQVQQAAQQAPGATESVAAPPPTQAYQASADPSPDFRYLGQMTGPDGQRQTFLARGDKSMAVAVGAEVEGGYRVQAIDAQGVRLQHPSQGVTLVIPVPPAPEGASP